MACAGPDLSKHPGLSRNLGSRTAALYQRDHTLRSAHSTSTQQSLTHNIPLSTHPTARKQSIRTTVSTFLLILLNTFARPVKAQSHGLCLPTLECRITRSIRHEKCKDKSSLKLVRAAGNAMEEVAGYCTMGTTRKSAHQRLTCRVLIHPTVKERRVDFHYCCSEARRNTRSLICRVFGPLLASSTPCKGLAKDTVIDLQGSSVDMRR